MVYLMNDAGECVMEFARCFVRRKGQPTQRTEEHSRAIELWRSRDDLHFEDSIGAILNPFTLEVED